MLGPVAEVLVGSDVVPTVDFTDRLGGASDGDPDLANAYNVGGALFTNDIDIAEIGAGSGVLKSFVRVSANTDTVHGYNTSGRPMEFDENTSPTFTHDLPLSVIPLSYFDVDGDGVDEAFRQFRLDINENDTDLGRWLSLDTVEVWQSNGYREWDLLIPQLRYNRRFLHTQRSGNRNRQHGRVRWHRHTELDAHDAAVPASQ